MTTVYSKRTKRTESNGGALTASADERLLQCVTPVYPQAQAAGAVAEGSADHGLSTPLARAIADLEAAAEFLRSRYVEGLIAQALYQAVARAQSPWLTRELAAEYVHCSVSEIDRAARALVVKTHYRSGTPLFFRSDLDNALAEGRWPKRTTKSKQKP